MHKQIKFALTQEETNKFYTWSEGHEPSLDAIGTQYMFSFIPTGLGTITTVTNLVTNEELNLTDYENF
jgi:hypothetical protein